MLISGCRVADNSDGTPATRPDRYGLGETPAPSELAALDVDVNPSGAGLPAGRGTHGTGTAVYAQKCALCHGAKGEGIDKNPRLIGRVPPPGFTFANDFKAPKTIGNYWPYATTLYDYIRRTMPFNAPGSMTADETYGVVAFLLAENGIITTSTAVDAKSLAAIQMPARSKFVRDDRTGGPTFR